MFFSHSSSFTLQKKTELTVPFRLSVRRERHHSIPTWHKQGMHSSENALKRVGELGKGGRCTQAKIMPQILYIVLRVQHAVTFTIFQLFFFFSYSQQSLNSLKMAASIFETAKSWEGFVQGGKDLSGLLTYELKHLHLSPSWFKTSCLNHEVIIFIQNSVCLTAPILSALHLQSVAQGQVNAYCMTDLHAINFVVWRELLQFLCWFTIFLIDVNVTNK